MNLTDKSNALILMNAFYDFYREMSHDLEWSVLWQLSAEKPEIFDGESFEGVVSMMDFFMAIGDNSKFDIQVWKTEQKYIWLQKLCRHVNSKMVQKESELIVFVKSILTILKGKEDSNIYLIKNYWEHCFIEFQNQFDHVRLTNYDNFVWGISILELIENDAQTEKLKEKAGGGRLVLRSRQISDINPYSGRG